ncbi:hypothetical protein [Streptomyces sp. HUAS TT7]
MSLLSGGRGQPGPLDGVRRVSAEGSSVARKGEQFRSESTQRA